MYITVWKDGSWKRWPHRLDAVYAENDPDWLATIVDPEIDAATEGA